MTTKTLTVGEAFSPPLRGKGGLSKAYIKDHPGPYPVFSAATTGPLGYIDTFSHTGTALSWSTNGYAGNIMVLHGEYSMTADRAVVVPRVKGLDLEFCRMVLQAKFREAARGRRIDGKKNEYTKLTADLVRDIEFEVPVDSNGQPDGEAQAAHVAHYARISSFQVRAREMSKIIAGALPKPSVEGLNTRSVALLDTTAFRFIRKETSWGKKDWHRIATGDESHYPVYSAAKGPVAYVDVETPKRIDASPSHKIVSFAVDGDSSAGGNLVVHSRPFYVSTNRACFEIVHPLIDAEYVFHSLSTMKADHGFDFSYKAYKAHLVDVRIDVPITPDGHFDLAAQQLAAARRSRLLALRDGAIRVMTQIASATVEQESYAEV